MDDITNRLQSLSNVQLRTELLKHGEKVGPVTPTTRKLFLSKLAKKIFTVEHPDAVTGIEDSVGDGKETEAGPVNARSGGGDGETGAVLTPTTTKSALDRSGEREEPSAYYVVILAESPATTPNIGTAEHRVFTEKVEALAFMKKNAGSRLKVFHSSTEVKTFVSQLPKQAQEKTKPLKPKQSEEPSNNNLATEAEKSNFKGPRVQDLVQFRKVMEKGDVDTVKTTVWNNPRYLITSADTPVILHEGMRHNALHIAAKSNQAGIATSVLETLFDPEFTKLLYCNSHDTEQSRYHRITYLVDLYLNSPDKGSGETPLHIACKMGHTAVVRCLVAFSVTDRHRINKFCEKPETIICSRYKGEHSAAIKEEIQELLQGLCLVPLLRSRDNITLPMVGEPCSPDDKGKLCDPATVPSLAHSPKEPRRTLSAFAGPMSPSKARDFQKKWMNPRCQRNSADAKEVAAARRTDAEKGYERIGRKLARELHVPWTEYWKFLDAFADFSTPRGLQKLEEHLKKQQTLVSITRSMEADSSCDDGSVSDASASDSADDSQGEGFFSCDEGTTDEKSDPSKVSQKEVGASETVEVAEEADEDVFEDSLDSFFDSQSYVFGKRLQLKSSNNNKVPQKGKDTKAVSEGMGDVSKTQKKNGDGNSSLWSYRESIASGEHEQKLSETSVTSNTTHSFDASSPTPDTPSDETGGGKQSSDGKNYEKLPGAKMSTEMIDKSFNTMMTELSEEMEVKLIFSPDGKVVRSPKGRFSPDVGVCLGREIFNKALRNVTRRECPLDIVIKSRKGSKYFLVDVLIRTSSTAPATDEEFFDDSSDDLSNTSAQKVMTDVKILAKSEAVLEHVWRIVRPVHLTVGILEKDAQSVKQHFGSVTARIVHRRRRNSNQMACYVFGNKPCKTDLDVMRAMCECDVDPTTFPTVHSWLSLVSATRQEGKDSWPSPARLRHQHRLSQLHSQSLTGSPFPISPLVQGGTLTSTPVSRSSLPGIHCNRDLSPERPALMKGPRTWLFKSPT
ncbi:ankyrin repeat and LEM domain-containing protein 2-like isoform X2 [Littorina saxatilis]|uniref:ankyrin repeat and LEM domain-containing protein 2-like isoform X2 n=1 Tax=Littorina saxatilis TaxID=31220 RepID=UPI0038B48730